MYQPKLTTYQRSLYYAQGKDHYLDGNPELYPDAEYQSPGYYMNAGWRAAAREASDQELETAEDNGLDWKSLDKLRQQLEALGFTIPNEEN
jgi:hypothetical protein